MRPGIDAGKLSAVMFARFHARPGRVTMPDVCCDLVWLNGSLWLAGPQSSARPSAAVGQDIQLVNIDPLMARAWLGVPLHELTDRKFLLTDIDARHAEWLSEMFDAGHASRLVGAQADHVAAVDPRAAAADAALRQGRSIKDAAMASGLSERQLERLCQDWFGLSPKRYAQILRLRQAVKRVKDGKNLAEAALLSGYADQSHFNRDVRTLTGTTPRALLPNVGNVQDTPINLREY